MLLNIRSLPCSSLFFTLIATELSWGLLNNLMADCSLNYRLKVLISLITDEIGLTQGLRSISCIGND